MTGAKSIDAFLDRVPSADYNCIDFVQEVWLYLTGENVKEKLTGLIGDFSSRKVTISGVRAFKRLPEPIEPCFIVMQRPKTVPHCGICLERRILHLTESGVQFQPLNVAKGPFKIIRYYR